MVFCCFVVRSPATVTPFFFSASRPFVKTSILFDHLVNFTITGCGLEKPFRLLWLVLLPGRCARTVSARHHCLFGTVSARHHCLFGTVSTRHHCLFGTVSARHHCLFGTVSARHHCLFGTVSARNHCLFGTVSCRMLTTFMTHVS